MIKTKLQRDRKRFKVLKRLRDMERFANLFPAYFVHQLFREIDHAEDHEGIIYLTAHERQEIQREAGAAPTGGEAAHDGIAKEGGNQGERPAGKARKRLLSGSRKRQQEYAGGIEG